MATPTIPNGEEHFFPVIYEGNGKGRRVGKFVPFTDNGTIANSVIYNRSDNPYMSFDKSSITPDSDKKFTFSCWFKLGELGSRLNTGIFNSNSGGEAGGNVTRYAPLLTFTANGNIFGYDYDSGGYNWYFSTNRTFEDTSKWYHFVLAIDTTQSTSTDRMKVYIDGNQITSFSSSTYPALNQDLYTVMAGGYHILGLGYNVKFDGYLAEVNLIENQQLTPSTFGITDTSTNRWIPKTLTGITYGTNGFRLKFQDSSALGDDTSGNTNDFSVTNLVAGDQTTDSPTQNFNTMGSFSSGVTKAEGNLKITTPTLGSGYLQCVGQPAFGVSSGKWYWEVKVNVKGASAYGWKSDDNTGGSQANSTGNYQQGASFAVGTSGGIADGEWDFNYSTGVSEQSFTTASVDDVIMFAIDLDNRKGYVGLNGTWFNSANPANGTGSIGLGRNPVPSANARFYPMVVRNEHTGTGTYNFGATSFAHTPPTGFVALGQDNLPEATKGISGLVWTKNRDATDNHQWYDSSRGKQLVLASSAQDGESTVTDGLQKFLAGGQQIEDSDAINTASESFVSWNWVANGGTTASNTDGSITSTVQANTTAGFSIVQYTGTGSAATVGHGLSKKIDWMIIKELGNSNGWIVSHKGLTSQATYSVNLSNSNAEYSDAGTYYWNNAAPTSSVFSIATDSAVNRSSGTYVAYCWHEVDGFSKFGKYTGNANADGPFIYTGFRPAWVMVKNASASSSWAIFDNKRDSFNASAELYLLANSTAAEATHSTLSIDFVSNGFKIRGTDGGYNGSGNTIIYMAFAEHPFVGDGTSPVTAR